MGKAERNKPLEAEFKVKDNPEAEEIDSPETVEKNQEYNQIHNGHGKKRIDRRRKELQRIKHIASSAEKNKNEIIDLVTSNGLPKENKDKQTIRNIVCEDEKVMAAFEFGSKQVDNYDELMAAKEPVKIEEIVKSLLDNGSLLAEGGISNFSLVEFPISVVLYADKHELLDTEIIKKAQSLNYSVKMAKLANLVDKSILEPADIPLIVNPLYTALKQLVKELVDSEDPNELAQKQRELIMGGTYEDYRDNYPEAAKRWDSSPDHEDIHDTTLDVLYLRKENQEISKEIESLEEKLREDYTTSEEEKRKLLGQISAKQIEIIKLNELDKEAQSRIVELNGLYTTEATQRMSLEYKLKTANGKNGNLTKLNSTYEVRVNELNEALEEAAEEVEQMEKDAAKQKGIYNKEIAKSKKLGEEVETNKDTITKLKQEIENANQEYKKQETQLKDQLKGLEENAKSDKGKIANLAKSKSAYERKANGLETDLKAAQDGLAMKKKQYSLMLKDNKNQKKTIKGLEEKANTYFNDIARLKNELEKAENHDGEYIKKIYDKVIEPSKQQEKPQEDNFKEFAALIEDMIGRTNEKYLSVIKDLNEGYFKLIKDLIDKSNNNRPPADIDYDKISKAFANGIHIENIGNPQINIPAGYGGNGQPPAGGYGGGDGRGNEQPDAQPHDEGHLRNEVREALENIANRVGGALGDITQRLDRVEQGGNNRGNGQAPGQDEAQPEEERGRIVPFPGREDNREQENAGQEQQPAQPAVPTGVAEYLNLRKQIDNEITGMRIDIMLAYANSAKEVLGVEGDIRQIDMSELANDNTRAQYKTSLNSKLASSSQQKMFIDNVRDQSHAESIMYGWLGFTQSIVEGTVDAAKAELELENIWVLGDERRKIKSTLPHTRIQESDTREVLQYSGLQSTRDTLDKAALINIIEIFENQRSITPKQMEGLNSKLNAGLSYGNAA